MTDAELAVLSLIVEQPRHGYEIEQVIADRGMREWTGIGFSSIYYVLGKMERQGLVEAKTSVGEARGPARKVYSPTTAGTHACSEAVLLRLSQPRAASPFLLGLSNVVGLPQDEAIEALGSYGSVLEETLERVSARREEQGPLPLFVDDVFDYSVTMLKAERGWVSRLVGRLEHEHEEAEKMPRTVKTKGPEIVELPDVTMAAAHLVGDPAEVASKVMPALYGAAYGLKFELKKSGVDYKVAAPRARWLGGPDWMSLPRSEWESVWGIPIPDDTVELAQKVPDVPVTVETWQYGTIAQVVFVGSYADEEPTIVDLHSFIAEQGYEIAGPHEEEYLSRPDAKNPKTIIRYQVRRRT